MTHDDTHTGSTHIRYTHNTCDVHTQGVPTLPELKLHYYQLMIRYYAHANNYLEITRCYRSIFEVESVHSNAEKWWPVGVCARV